MGGPPGRLMPGCDRAEIPGMDAYDPGVTSDARPPSDEPSARRRLPRRRRTWLIGGLVVAFVAAWSAVAGYQVLQARRHAQRGLDELRVAQQQLDPAELIRGKGLPRMRAAEADFREAADAAESLFVTPFEVLPVVGRQVRSLRALTNGASTVVAVGVEAMHRSATALDSTARTGPERVALLEQLGVIGADASKGLKDVSLGPGNALIGPLASARAKFARQLHKAQRAMSDVRDTSDGLAQMAKGPSKYLLLAANNGEMRAGSGMLLSAGVLAVQDGKFSLGPMQSVTDLELPPGAVTPTGDFAKRWSWLGPTEDWRFLAMSPQFDVTGRFAAQMWKAKTGETVDGVVALDPIALRALVKVSGPVEVGGSKVDAGNIVREILLQQYIDYATENTHPEDDLPVNAERRERNGEIARAIVDRLDMVEWKIPDLVDDLRSAARGRHVLFWSDQPTQQRAWRAAGVSGTLPSDGFMISVANQAGNKLDQFLPVTADISRRAVADGSEVTVTMTVANHAPDGMPRYVQGPYPFEDFVAGEYRGILAVTVPYAAQDVRLEGAGQRVASGPDGSTQVVAGRIRLLRNQTGTYTARFRLPTGYEHLEVIPSARYPTIAYTAGSQHWDDSGPRPLSW